MKWEQERWTSWNPRSPSYTKLRVRSVSHSTLAERARVVPTIRQNTAAAAIVIDDLLAIISPQRFPAVRISHNNSSAYPAHVISDVYLRCINGPLSRGNMC